MEIVYQYPQKCHNYNLCPNIRWLSFREYDIFINHLEACGQRPISEDLWKEISDEGTIYCGLFIGGTMAARACVEKYAEDKWEVSDARTVLEFRNQGYAFQVCAFVLDYILSQGKIATIRTEDDNFAMLKVIRNLGFIPLK